MTDVFGAGLVRSERMSQRRTVLAILDPLLSTVLQNAVVVKEAEEYYRTIYESYEAAWTIRDRYMFNALVGEIQT